MLYLEPLLAMAAASADKIIADLLALASRSDSITFRDWWMRSVSAAITERSKPSGGQGHRSGNLRA